MHRVFDFYAYALLHLHTAVPGTGNCRYVYLLIQL